MTSSYRTMLTFSVSSYILLTQLEQEFIRHSGVTSAIAFDGEAFIVCIECSDSAVAVWDVRMLVLTFDPGCALLRQTAQLFSGTFDQTVA